MKKYLFVLLIGWCSYSQAQTATTNALKIGDQVPNVTLDHILNYHSPSAQLSDFKGKLLILDFWATWCAPCVGMIPVMDSLQKQFDDKIQFLPVAYQPEAVIRNFKQKLAEQHRPAGSLPEIVGDNVLMRLFPHTSLPHYVWIDDDGKVIAITEHSEVTAQNISRILAGSASGLSEKKDAVQKPYDNREPLFVNGNGGNGGNLLYRSMLTGYTPGLSAGVAELPMDSINGLKITLRNINLMWLYQTAYGEKKEFYPRNRIKIMVSEPGKITNDLKGKAYLDWLAAGNGFCYELTVSASLAGNAYPIMQHDLAMLFPQYTAQVEKQKMECLVLVRTNSSVNLAATAGTTEAGSDATGFQFKGQPLSSLVFQLNAFYMQLSPYPVIDETGYVGNVDLDLKANPSDADSMNKALKAYGLELVKASREIKVIAIRDTGKRQVL